MAATISANSAGGGGLVSSGDASGVLALQTAGVTALSISAAQVVSFTNPVALTSATLTSPTITGAVVSAMASSILTSGTAVASTSGTSIDFTGIPSWVKRITVMFNGVSTSGTSAIQAQIGGGSIETIGYNSVVGVITGAYPGAAAAATATSGFLMEHNSQAAAFLMSGHLVITNVSGNIWVASGIFGTSTVGTMFLYAGNKTTSVTLDRIRITTVNGTDTFDAGSINIMYE